MTTVEILRKAKAELEQRGLHKGAHMPAGGDPATCPLCVEGALNFDVNGNPTKECHDFPAFLQFLRSAVGEWAHTWNDRPETTLSDVLVGLDRAIVIALASQPQGPGDGNG